MRPEMLVYDRRLIYRLTLLLVVLYGPMYWSARLPVTVVGVAMLARADWLESRTAWALLLALMAEGVGIQWFRIDNHQFLITYWLLAVNLSLYADNPDRSLGRMAGSLIGGTFVFATAWKIGGGEFVNGVFWEGMLLTDDRLSVAAQLLGGLSPAVLQENLVALTSFSDPVSGPSSIALQSSVEIDVLARRLSWIGMGLEGAIAALFILPQRFMSQWIRIGALLAFQIGVYSALPVPGFGWVLGVMAIAHTPQQQQRLRSATFWVLIALIFSTAPKRELFAAFL